MKLSSELSRRSTGHTLYVLDEPTTGLHFDDVRKLLEVLSRLVDQGNTVIVIEHNLDVIKTADWIVDLGPEGRRTGRHGGRRGHARGRGRHGRRATPARCSPPCWLGAAGPTAPDADARAGAAAGSAAEGGGRRRRAEAGDHEAGARPPAASAVAAQAAAKAPGRGPGRRTAQGGLMAVVRRDHVARSARGLRRGVAHRTRHRARLAELLHRRRGCYSPSRGPTPLVGLDRVGPRSGSAERDGRRRGLHA